MIVVITVDNTTSKYDDNGLKENHRTCRRLPLHVLRKEQPPADDDEDDDDDNGEDAAAAAVVVVVVVVVEE